MTNVTKESIEKMLNNSANMNISNSLTPNATGRKSKVKNAYMDYWNAKTTKNRRTVNPLAMNSPQNIDNSLKLNLSSKLKRKNMENLLNIYKLDKQDKHRLPPFKPETYNSNAELQNTLSVNSNKISHAHNKSQSINQQRFSFSSLQSQKYKVCLIHKF